MARRLGWFDLRNNHQRKKDEDRFLKQVFPLGEEQKDCELAILKQLVPTLKPADALYQLIQIKGIMQSDDAEWEQDDWEKTQLAKRLKPDERKKLFALAKESFCWKSIEEIPTPEAMLEKLVI